MPGKVKSNTKQRILTVAIAVVLTLFVAYGISVFYEAPKYEKFCGVEPKPVYLNETSCNASEGKWNPNYYPCPAEANGISGKCAEGYCDADFTCRKEFDLRNEVYNRNVFVVSLFLGLVLMILGITLKLESVSVGIMGGGALVIFYGVMRYWGELGKYWRLLLLGLVLATLIWIGYKKFGKN